MSTLTRLAVLGGCLAWASLPGEAAELALSRGQLLYVPVYSEVPFGDRGFTLNLTATLSIRNTDRKAPITLERIDYVSATGALVRSYLRGRCRSSRSPPRKPSSRRATAAAGSAPASWWNGAARSR